MEITFQKVFQTSDRSNTNWQNRCDEGSISIVNHQSKAQAEDKHQAPWRRFWTPWTTYIKIKISLNIIMKMLIITVEILLYNQWIIITLHTQNTNTPHYCFTKTPFCFGTIAVTIRFISSVSFSCWSIDQKHSSGNYHTSSYHTS